MRIYSPRRKEEHEEKQEKGLHLKPQLQPLKVPWQIVTDTSYLRLNVSEVNHVEVSFIGHELHDRELNFVEFEITVKFENPIKTRTNPKWSDRNVINPSDYDWSKIDPHYLPHTLVRDLEQYRKQQHKFKKEWLSSNICPVPNAYVVSDSFWLTNYQNYQHYLFVGADSSVEVISQSFSWLKNEVDWFNDGN